MANEYPPHEVQQQTAPAPQGMYARMHAMLRSAISGYPILAMPCHTTSYYSASLFGLLVLTPNSTNSLHLHLHLHSLTYDSLPSSPPSLSPSLIHCTHPRAPLMCYSTSAPTTLLRTAPPSHVTKHFLR